MKIITKEEAANLIKDNMTLAISGSGGSGSPEALLTGIMESYKNTNHPRNLTVTTGISPGNLTMDDVGMNKLSAKGLVGKAICAHLGMGKKFGNEIGANEFPAFAIPLGVLNHLMRAIAGKEIGVLTKVGLNTFADPRIEGCCANELAKKEPPIVELINIDGKEQLLYKSFNIDACILKATYADTMGNISFEHEAVLGEQYKMAEATHNCGGIVIVEVEAIKTYQTLRAKDCLIHSSLVDYVVVAEPDLSLGDYNLPYYRPELTGDAKIELKSIEPTKLDERKICGRRAAMELKKGYVINLGVGMPDQVASVAAEEGFSNDVYLSVESGPMGGVPIGGVAFGSSINVDSILTTSDNFDMYNGGVLDMAIVGLAQVDKLGNVNVSKFGPRVTGPGGFINITQNTHKVIFIGTFKTSKLEEKVCNGKLEIVNEGQSPKFIKEIEQITFSAKNALLNKQEILYVTERAVFKLVEGGIELIEIAPGIDLEKDILNQMEFKPIINNIKIMDERIFKDEIMHLNIN